MGCVSYERGTPVQDAFGGEKPLRYTWDCNTNLNIQSEFMIGAPRLSIMMVHNFPSFYHLGTNLSIFILSWHKSSRLSIIVLQTFPYFYYPGTNLSVFLSSWWDCNTNLNIANL